MILFLDNYDSFSYNLIDYLKQTGKAVEVVKNDQDLPRNISEYEGVVLSPGPGRPETSGNLMPTLNLAFGTIPILGVCLGHQALGLYKGGQVVKALAPLHGKVRRNIVLNSESPLFEQIPKEHNVVRYHSLVLERKSLPEEFEIISASEQLEVMAIQHKSLPVYGVQYHPESILTEFGLQLIQNWVKLL